MNPVLLRVRTLLITTFHVLIIMMSVLIAFWVRFDFLTSSVEAPLVLTGLLLAAAVKMPAFILGGAQNGWWGYAGLSDLNRILLVNIAASVGWATIVLTLVGPQFPRSIYVIDF